MPQCTADAAWNGSLPDGTGQVSLGSGVWSDGFGTPNVDDVTDPEELLAAAHASCFAMTLALSLDEAGYTPVETGATSAVTVEHHQDTVSIPSIDVSVEATVPDATRAELQRVVDQAETFCPVSQALAGTKIEVATVHHSRD